MRLLHTADIHLDSPLRGLERYEGAPIDEVRGATRRAFENLIQTALRERVDLLLIAGDLYDGDWPDQNTGLFFARGMAQLAEAGIPVVLVRGNHDAASRITRTLRLPPQVRLLSEKRPETVVFDQLGVAVHGQSFAGSAVAEDLAAAYPAPLPGLLNIGLLHTSLTGRPGHDPYAPTSAAQLKAKGYHYWALGHVHRAEVVERDPWVVYPGNTQGRHIRESGAKGCALISVEDGQVTGHEPIHTDVMRWDTLRLPIADLPDLEALLEQAAAAMRERLGAAEGRPLALRLRIEGAGRLHARLAAQPESAAEQLRATAIDAGNGRIWVEKVTLDTRPAADLARIAGQDDPLGLLLRELRLIEEDAALREALGEAALHELLAKLPAELREGPGALQLMDQAVLTEIFSEVEGELLAQLSGEAAA